MKKLLLFSGGIDSTTMLLKLLKQGHDVSCISFDYGQTHNVELDVAKNSCSFLKIAHNVVTIEKVTKYKDTYIGRNLILVTEALKFALNNKYNTILVGVNKDDTYSFEDCTENFLISLRNCCYTYGVKLEYPLINMSKLEVMSEFNDLNSVFNLETWTCYTPVNGLECGKCSACKLKEVK